MFWKGWFIWNSKNVLDAGCFFVSDNDVCCNCYSKDQQDIYKLNDFIASTGSTFSVDSLAYNTGVSSRNIARFIANKQIVNI